MHYHTHCIAHFNNISVFTKENGDVWRIVTESDESGNLILYGNPSDGSSFFALYGFVIKS
jgi:hypothetical protein